MFYLSKIAGKSSTAVEQLFPGQYYDVETELNYNYFRSYNPATGRYTQSDPIGLIGGNNLYAYVDSNAVTRSDPLGLVSDLMPSGPKSPKGKMPWYVQVICFLNDLYTSNREQQLDAWEQVNRDNLRKIDADCDATYSGCASIENTADFQKCVYRCSNDCSDRREKQWEEYAQGVKDINDRYPPSPIERTCEVLSGEFL